METVNIKIAGLGGMEGLNAASLLAEAALIAGYDIKKAEVRGMPMHGEAVACDVRFGSRVLSPMIPQGEVDYLVVLEPEWIELYRGELRSSGKLLTPSDVEGVADREALGIALMGALSRFLPIPEAAWREALAQRFPEELLASNLAAFEFGRGKADAGCQI